MAILPVVGLEQVIAQSPALMGERVRDQKKEEGPSATGSPKLTGDNDGSPPVEGVRPVDPVGEEGGTEGDLEKEDESEYPVGKKSRSSRGARGPGGKMPRHRLDIRA